MKPYEFMRFYHPKLGRFVYKHKGSGIIVDNISKPMKSVSSRGDGVTSAFSKLRPIWISHLYYFFPKMGKLK